MCDLVQAYADEEKIKMLAELFSEGALSIEDAVRKLEVTEEQFLGYVEQYQKENIEHV